jgi:hypothetical protein
MPEEPPIFQNDVSLSFKGNLFLTLPIKRQSEIPKGLTSQ